MSRENITLGLFESKNAEFVDSFIVLNISADLSIFFYNLVASSHRNHMTAFRMTICSLCEWFQYELVPLISGF